MTKQFANTAYVWFWLLAACAGPLSPRELLVGAQEAHARGDRCAYFAFAAVPHETAAGRDAEALLARATQEYQAGIGFFAKSLQARALGDAVTADLLASKIPIAFARGYELAPMPPEIVRSLAEAYAEAENFEKSTYWYQRYLQLLPTEKSGTEALCDANALLEKREQITAPRQPEVPTTTPPQSFWQIWLGVFLALVAMVLVFLSWRRREPGLTLQELVRQKPETSKELEREIASIRHELIKHRLGLSPALAPSQEPSVWRSLVVERFHDDLLGDFQKYYNALQRIALGRLVPAREDPILSLLERAVQKTAKRTRTIASRPQKLAEIIREIAEMHKDWLQADRALAALIASLNVTTVDAVFLRGVVEELRSEPKLASIQIDSLEYRECTPAPEVRMYAPDLRTVLKNLARNALQALSRRESPRRLAFQIELQLEMTGEESVLISVVDNAAPLAAEVVETPKPQSGLWLVQQTLRQYDGALTLDPNPTQTDYTKALVVRLFRV